MNLLTALGIERAFERLDVAGPSFDRYYGRMGGGGLLKMTRPGRFSELDALLVTEIDRRFERGRTIRVHDAAASSAITSLELYDTLRCRGPATVRASDFYDAIHVLDGSIGSFVFDAEFEPLQIAVGRAALSARKGLLRHLVSPLWRSALKRRAAARLVSLFHPRARTRAGEDPGFALVRESFHAPAPGPYEAVRLLNALWPSLGEERTAAVLRAAIATLTDDGILVLGRAGNYTIFGRTPAGFEMIGGTGSHLENRQLLKLVSTVLDQVPQH